MQIVRLGRASLLLLFFMLTLPMIMPLSASARDRSKPTKVTDGAPEDPEVTRVVNRIIASENLFDAKLMGFTPRIETYVQYYQPDAEQGDVPRNDAVFLGRLKFDKEAKEVTFFQNDSPDWFRHRPFVLGKRLNLDGFAVESLSVDNHSFNRQHYVFEPVRWEYLGDLRCLAVDVHPLDKKQIGAFVGRIWVEDHDYAIVRLNGTRINPPRWSFYIHFDCWRENLQPGLWLPVYVYSQESDLGKRLRYKAETRFWGYDLTAHPPQQEWTNILVDAPAPVRDRTEAASDMSPVQSERLLIMDAERNVLDRLEKARLIAPPGPVDKVLETVVNNLVVTNHLDSLPPIHCRVMLTSTLESFSLAYTIVLSRGLIDVLPDEPSLAMMLAHELAHIALGQKIDSKYAFADRTQVTDEQLLASLDVARSGSDEAAADAKGIDLLRKSPYNDKLGQAGLFLRAAFATAPHTPRLFGAHLGNGLTEGGDRFIRMAALMSGSPELKPTSVSQVAALPLGSRLQVSAWDGAVTLTTRTAESLVDASEKMPFRVTPVVPYLRLYPEPPKTEAAASVKN
jgi:hypothetical protein